VWHDTQEPQQELFSTNLSTQPVLITQHKFFIAKEFFTLAETVSYHRDSVKWQRLYMALWRITHGEKHLMAIKSDPLIHQLLIFEKNVRRDSHKMKAFVRFRMYQEAEKTFYVAWHVPDHKILRRVAPFFKRRFSVMHWTIITPDDTCVWDETRLTFYKGIQNFKHTEEDKLEQLWRTYYRAIFNPARIKMKAMKNEMPVRYWKNMPETSIIQDILTEAPARVQQMLKYSEGIKTSAKDYFPENINLVNLSTAAKRCQACPIWACAKQTVYGTGNSQAEIMIVGEQPGRQEDEAGTPFVGPTGEYLKKALAHLSIPLSKIYFTNAVKHFKHRVEADKIIYQTPTINEINACKPWLLAEIDLIKPKMIICLGLVAAKSLLSAGFHFKQNRGILHTYEQIPVMPTYHPSAILRCKVTETKSMLANLFLQDLQLTLK